jgi:hypothetical protein
MKKSIQLGLFLFLMLVVVPASVNAQGLTVERVTIAPDPFALRQDLRITIRVKNPSKQDGTDCRAGFDVFTEPPPL